MAEHLLLCPGSMPNAYHSEGQVAYRERGHQNGGLDLWCKYLHRTVGGGKVEMKDRLAAYLRT